MQPKIIFETERLLVRTYVPADADVFFSINANPDVVRFIRPPKTREESDRFLQEAIRYSELNPLYGRWAIVSREGQAFLGTFVVIPIENSERMQLGYAFLPEYWGRGYATEITVAGLHYVFQKTELTVIYAVVQKDNLSSLKVLQKAGFAHAHDYVEADHELSLYYFEKGWLK